jgi:PAS domain S-box-containing protein
LIYYRDPLLDTISDRIADLDRPAYIKNSELVYVAVNDAYARLFNLEPGDLIGTGRGEYAEVEALLDIEDKERACLVFGDDQRALHSDPFGGGRFSVDLERFTLADGQTFVYVVFEPLAGNSHGATRVSSAPLSAPASQDALSADLGRRIVENLDAGICIFDREDRLSYFNKAYGDIYSPVIGPLRVGLGFRDILEMLARAAVEHDAASPLADPDVREHWIDDRLAKHRLPHTTEAVPLCEGTWLHCENRLLQDGSVLCLRVDIRAMRKQEERLKAQIEENDLYRELLNHLPVAAFARGSDHKLRFANRAYADLTGRNQEEMIGGEEVDLYGPDGEAIRAHNTETLLHGVEVEQELDRTLPDGSLRSSIVKTRRVLGRKGDPYLIGAILDVSALRQRELQLEQAMSTAEAARRDLEDIMSSISVGMIVLDENLDIHFMNDAYKTRVWGRAMESWEGEIVGRPYRELLLNTFQAGLQPVGTDFEDYFATRSAEIRSRVPYASERMLEDGKVLLFSGVPLDSGKSLLCYFDLTELRKRDREVLEAHEDADRAYKLVLSATDTMPEGLMVLEGDTIVLTNRSLPTLLGIPAEVLEPGQSWEDAYLATLGQQVEFDPAQTGESIERFRTAIQSRKDLSYDFPIRGGRWIHLEMRARDNGQTVIICSDETKVVHREEDLRRLVSKAEAADRAKSEFLANMSHEIRTPMNGILGMAELLSKSFLDTRQKTFVEIIMKSGSALLTIINDILDFSRLDAGQMQLKIAPFDPVEAVEDVATLLASRAAEKDIELIIRRKGDVPAMVDGDPGRFRQIVTNLLGNAVKFTESGHVVTTVSGRIGDDGAAQIEVTVEDTGIGIPADKLQTIFEQFSQVDSSSTRRHEGTGLGLAISERLARLQGGMIAVESEEGAGSRFTLSLPLKVAAMRARRKPLPINVEGARVLVIDDNEVNRTILMEQVAEWGFEGAAAPDGETGLEIIEAAREHGLAIDLVILDCQMPGINGAEVARRIRANPANDRSAIIFLTSVDIVDTDENISELKVQAHLMKPARSAILRDTAIEVVRGARIGYGASSLMLRAGTVAPAADARPPMSAETPAPLAAVSPRVAAARSPQPRYGHVDVLVAEDNDVNRIVFSQILEAAGVSFRIVGNGAEAVEAWQQDRPAIIMMDISMPVMNGLQATAEIREREIAIGGHVPIVGVTAHALDGDREMCLSAGMDDYITKPISPERLEDKIRQWAGIETPDLTVSAQA